MMAEKSNKQATQSEIRATALKHALNLEEKKKLKSRVADLVLEAYDLPSSVNADPAHPVAADVALFRNCLSLFQPLDLDDLIQERNIDNRCGYALCPKANRKVVGGGEKVWNQKGGKDFRVVDKVEMERWCSKACGKRTAFVRAQLSPEPSWARQTQNEVRLLDELGHVDDVSGAVKALAKDGIDEDMAGRLLALSLERGEDAVNDVSEQVSIVENMNSGVKPNPPTHGDQSIEGHHLRKVRFAQN